jgi:pimeloyl-ACP methyl ester carboxylesterase
MVRIAGESPRTARHVKLSPPEKADSVILCCEIVGDGPPAVLVPGLGDSVWVWRRLIPYLQHHHRVTAVELRGHGRSASPFGPYSVKDLAEDLALLSQKLNIREATFIAQGLGARAAMTLAAEKPDIVSALVLIGAETGPPTVSTRGSLVGRMEHAARGDMQAAYKLRKGEGREPRGMSSRERAEHHRIFLRNSPAGYNAACYAELSAPDFSGRLGEIHCPVLAVAGELDPDRLADAERMTETIPDCESIIVAGAGHFVQLDRTETFHALLDEFFRKHLRKLSK